MLWCGVAVTIVIGVSLDDVGIFQVFLHQCLHPFARNDVRAVLLAGVQFYAHAPRNLSVHLLVSLYESLCREVAGEIHHRLVTRALIVRHISVAVAAGCHLCRCRCCRQDTHHSRNDFLLHRI